MFGNINKIQMFGETAKIVATSGNMLCDEFSGVLYPGILLLIRVICMSGSFPWYTLMYLIQIVLGFCAGFFLLREVNFYGRRWFACTWGSLVIMTFPFVMQNHLAILSNSVSLSLLMLETAFALKGWKRTASKTDAEISGNAMADIACTGLFWVLGALNEWVLLYVGALPVLALVIKQIVSAAKKRKETGIKAQGGLKKLLVSITVIVAYLVIILGSNNYFSKHDIYSADNRNVTKIVFERLIWKSAFYRPASWMYEFSSVLDEGTMLTASLYPSSVRTIIEPRMEEILGPEGAEELYKYCSNYLWTYRKKEIIHDMAIDYAGYAISPVLVRMLLDDNTYVSYTMRNYDVMKRVTPRLTKWYVDYSLLWFEIALVLGSVIWALRLFERFRIEKDKREKTYPVFWIICILVGLVLSAWYMMQGSGVYDYKCSGFFTALYLLFAICSCSKNVTEDK